MIYLPDFLKTNHLIEKASKVRFLKPEKLQNHSNERKRKEKKKERGEEKEEKKKKAMVALFRLGIYYGYSQLNTRAQLFEGRLALPQG